MAADLFAQQFGNQSPQNAYFKKLLDQGLDTTPIQSPYQGASRLAMALLAGLDLRDQDQQEKASQALRMNLPGLGPQPAAPAQSGGLADALAKPAGDPNQPAPMAAGSNYSDAISRIESGGNYGAMGPVTAKGDRAYGKYQVMGSNVGPWTQQFVGQKMTPDQFVANPQAQDAVFNGQFGQYANKYGPVGAAKAWFAGEKGMNDPNRTDQNGTTVAQYGAKFAGALPPGMVQSPPDAALPPNSAPAQGQIPTVPQAAPAVTPQPNAGAQIPQRSPVQIDPQMAQQIRTMIGSKDPAIQQQGYALYQQFAKPREETRPLTNPQDRARYGIAPTDSNPYQVDSKGEVKPINPQPFNVNVNNQGQSEFEKHYGEGQAKSALATLDRGNAAVDKLQKIELTQSLLQKVQTGKLAPAQATIGAWAEAVGMKPETLKSLGVDPNMAMASQAAQGLMAQQTISMIGQGGFPANNFSDADRKFLQQIPGSISNVQGANEIAGEIGRRVAQRDIDKANAWADARGNGVGYEKFERDWRKKVAGENMFADLQQKIGAMSNGQIGGQAPAQQPAQAPAQGGVRKFNPATGKIE